MTEERKLTFRGIELEPDAWERLTRAVGVIGKVAPKHRPRKARSGSRTKSRETRGAKKRG